MTAIADRVAGAPISWGVCEVSGRGWQLDVATVLSQMQEVGLVATEFGPDGFLPDGYDARPVLAAGDAGRIRHTHLKDADATWARRVQSGDVSYTDAVRQGRYRPLGQGDVDIAANVGSLEGAGYDGWCVLEQGTILAGPPTDAGHGPIADVRASIEHLLAIARDLS